MGDMVSEAVGGCTGDTNLVFAAWLETSGFFGQLSEKPETLLFGGLAVLYHVDEIVYLGGDGGDGRGEDGVELAKVCKRAGCVEGENIEGEDKVVEQGERVADAGGHRRLSSGTKGHARQFVIRATHYSGPQV
jgi:hypothetical protein